MKDRASLGRIALVAVALVALAGAAAWARLAPEEEPLGETGLATDPATGSLLLDLDDDASDDAWAVARDAIARGVAPYAFVSDGSPRDELGALLSDEAELYRLEVPASEVSDVLRELEADAEPAYVDLSAHPEGEVVVEFWAGPAPGSPVSKRVKSAVLMYVEHQFTNRGVLATDSSAELPQGFETLLASLSHSGGW
jgi:hypothetical protein